MLGPSHQQRALSVHQPVGARSPVRAQRRASGEVRQARGAPVADERQPAAHRHPRPPPVAAAQRALSAPRRHDAAEAQGSNHGGVDRTIQRADHAAAGPGDLRGRPLDRPDLARAARADGGASAASARASGGHDPA